MSEEIRNIREKLDIGYNFSLGEINPLDCLMSIGKRKFLIFLLVIISVGFTSVRVANMDNIYEATAVISPITNTKESAGMAGLAMMSQSAKLLTGLTAPSSASSKEIMNLLGSKILREKMIDKYNLLPILFYKQWDEDNLKWKEDKKNKSIFAYFDKLKDFLKTALSSEKDKSKVLDKKAKTSLGPTNWDGLRELDDIIKIKNSDDTNSIIITVHFHDPEMTSKLATEVLDTLIEHMSNETRKIAEINKRYLEEQLMKTEDPFVQQKLYNMIAEQIESIMMTEVSENFAFKVIDPPKTPDEKISPKRVRIVLISFVVSLFFGVFLSLLLECIKKVKELKIRFDQRENYR